MSIEIKQLFATKSPTHLDSPTKRKFQLIKGLLHMVLSQMSFSSMAFVVKLLSKTTTITTFELLFYRSFCAVLFNSVYGISTNMSPLDVPKKHYRNLIYRSICGFFAVNFYFLSFFVMDISLAIVMNSLTPILTSIVAYVLLNETLSRYDIVGAIFAFGGVLMIVDPFSGAIHNYKWWAPLVPISSALTSSFALTFVRSLSKECNVLIAPYYFSLTTIVFVPAMLMASYKFEFSIQIYTWQIVLLIVVLSTFGFLGQLFQTTAIKYEKAGRATVMNYTGVIFGFMIDIFYFQIDYNYKEVLGSVMIVGVNVFIAILKAAEIIK